MSVEASTGLRSDYTEEHCGTWCVTGRPALAVPRMVLTQTAWTLRRLYLEKDRTPLQRLVCVQTLKGGYRTLRLTRLHRTHETDLSEEGVKKRKKRSQGGNDTLRSSTLDLHRLSNRFLIISQKPADCKSFTLWLPFCSSFLFYSSYHLDTVSQDFH